MSWFTRFLALRNGRGIVAWWRVFSSLLCVRVGERLLVCYDWVYCEFDWPDWIVLRYFFCCVWSGSPLLAFQWLWTARKAVRGKKAGERNRLDVRIEITPCHTPRCFFLSPLLRNRTNNWTRSLRTVYLSDHCKAWRCKGVIEAFVAAKFLLSSWSF